MAAQNKMASLAGHKGSLRRMADGGMAGQAMGSAKDNKSQRLKHSRAPKVSGSGLFKVARWRHPAGGGSVAVYSYLARKIFAPSALYHAFASRILQSIKAQV